MGTGQRRSGKVRESSVASASAGAGAGARRFIAAAAGVGCAALALSRGLGCSSDSAGTDSPDPHDVRETTPAPLVDLVASVDNRIGSGGGGYAQGQVFVGAQVPFGMVRPGPDTAGYMGDLGFAHTAGYWYLDDIIEGFSQLHLHGTGVEDFGNFLMMPTLEMSAAQTRKAGYQKPFRHETEVAVPGYYAVTLDEIDVRAELTASIHSAVHRYTFPADTATPIVLIDFGHGIGIEEAPDAEVVIDEATGEVTGWMFNAGRFTGERRAFEVYFAAQFDPKPVSVGVWNGDEVSPGDATARGGRVGGFLTFPAGTEQVVAHVGVSLMDVEQARRNRAETSSQTFDAVRAAATEAWIQAFERVSVRGGTEETQRIFAAGLYHSLLMPTQLSEQTNEGSRFVGLDRQRHASTDFVSYSDFSLWDTYRTLHPLLILVAPDRQRDMVKSLMQMTAHHGAPPRWPLAVNETGTMLGSPAAITMSESVVKGIDGLDTAAIFDAVVADADVVEGRTIRGGFSHCLEHGYCPADLVGRAVANSVEFGWADFAIAQLARHLGVDAESSRFASRARYWSEHFDKETKFLRGKNADGAWATSRLDTLSWTDDYAEGTAWQYLWSAPYDLGELSRQFGGKEPMLAKLTEFFEISEATPPPPIVAKDGVYSWDTHYWHGNEPDIHASYLFAMAGEPDLSAKWVDWVRRTKYRDDERGLSGNDDGGTLSAWYVLSAIGFYPIAGSDLYVIGSPLFDEVTLRLTGGDLVISAVGAGPGNIYVQSATLNGEPLDSPILRHSQLAPGGELRFVMGPTAAGWGRGEVFGPLD